MLCIFLFYVKSKVVYNIFYFSVMKEVTEESHHKENFPPHLMKVQNFIRHRSVAVLLEVIMDPPQQFLMFQFTILAAFQRTHLTMYLNRLLSLLGQPQTLQLWVVAVLLVREAAESRFHALLLITVLDQILAQLHLDFLTQMNVTSQKTAKMHNSIYFLQENNTLE